MEPKNNPFVQLTLVYIGQVENMLFTRDFKMSQSSNPDEPTKFAKDIYNGMDIIRTVLVSFDQRNTSLFYNWILEVRRQLPNASVSRLQQMTDNWTIEAFRNTNDLAEFQPISIRGQQLSIILVLVANYADFVKTTAESKGVNVFSDNNAELCHPLCRRSRQRFKVRLGETNYAVHPACSLEMNDFPVKLTSKQKEVFLMFRKMLNFTEWIFKDAILQSLYGGDLTKENTNQMSENSFEKLKSSLLIPLRPSTLVKNTALEIKDLITEKSLFDLILFPLLNDIAEEISTVFFPDKSTYLFETFAKFPLTIDKKPQVHQNFPRKEIIEMQNAIDRIPKLSTRNTTYNAQTETAVLVANIVRSICKLEKIANYFISKLSIDNSPSVCAVCLGENIGKHQEFIKPHCGCSYMSMHKECYKKMIILNLFHCSRCSFRMLTCSSEDDSVFDESDIKIAKYDKNAATEFLAVPDLFGAAIRELDLKLLWESFPVLSVFLREISQIKIQILNIYSSILASNISPNIYEIIEELIFSKVKSANTQQEYEERLIE